MQLVRKIATPLVTATVIAMTACASGEAPAAPLGQDFSIVGGCWVQKDAASGTIEAVLRLLPEGDDGDYAGEVHEVTEHQTSQQGFSFASDGSWATLWFIVSFKSRDPDRDMLPFGATFHFDREARAIRTGHSRHRATFRNIENPERTLVVDATADRLKITKLNRSDEPPVSVIFNGERDGCD